MKRKVGVVIRLDGTCMQSCGLVKSCCETDLVKSMVQIAHTDSTLVTSVPLAEDPVQVSARGILPSQSPSDVHHMFFVNGFLKCERLVCGLLLSFQDSCFKSLSWTITDSNGKTPSLVRVDGHVALVSLVNHLGSSPGVVSSEDVGCPLGVLEMGRLRVGNEHGSFGFLALGVIEFKGSVSLWI